METAMRETPFAGVLEELAGSRGLSGLEELVARVNAAGHGLRHVEGDLTVERLLEWPPLGYGDALEPVLGLSDDERGRLARAWVETFLRGGDRAAG